MENKKTVKVTLEVNEDILKELDSNLETELGWLEQSGMQVIKIEDCPERR